MSRLIANLLDVPEKLFEPKVGALEVATGQAGVDVRLTADIIANLHHCYKSLGLDPQDTTGPELYEALQALVAIHDRFLIRRLGLTYETDTEVLLSSIVTFISSLQISKTVWVIRASVAKRLLKSQPPKQIMRQLNHRSIDSMLRHESVIEVLAAIRFAESMQWQREFVQKYKKLQPKDFEERDIEIINLTEKRWGTLASEFVRKHRHNIIHCKEYGIIALLPLPVEQLPGIALAVIPRILHYMNEVRLYSAYFRFCQMQPQFGSIVVNTLLNDPYMQAKLVDNPIHWRLLQRHFGKSLPADFPELFDPHVKPEDLAWQSVEEILLHIEPALQFWQHLSYVGDIYEGKVTSCNLFDNANAYVSRQKYGQQPLHHLRRCLNEELEQRYLAHPSIEQGVLAQLTNSDGVEGIY